MSKDVILDQVFPLRAKAVLVLQAPASDADATSFKTLAEEAGLLAAAFGKASGAQRWHAFAKALNIVQLLVEWRHAVLTAAIDADRYLRAARLHLKQLRQISETDQFSSRLADALSVVEGQMDISEIEVLRMRLAGVPMPVAICTEPTPEGLDFPDKPDRMSVERIPKPAVAFVEFKINDVTAERIQTLRPHQKHDLDIAVRVSYWPETANSLVLSPISIDPPSSYDLPTFQFERPKGDPPYFFHQRGRMILHAAQNFRARPSEFIYTAEFHPIATETSVSIAGQRTLRLDGSGNDGASISGYPGIDAKLVSLRNQLRLKPLIPEGDLEDLLTILIPLSNLMGQSVQDNKFPVVISEAEFQNRIREWLRQIPAIGSALEQQPEVAGGRSDLSFRGIRIELKCESVKRLLPQDCVRYGSQPASYAVGTNRRVAVLCVLDCSPKTAVAFPAEDGLFVHSLDTGTSLIYIATLLIQGNLARPSSFSR